MAALPRLGLECQMHMPASCASLLADKRLPTGEQGKVMAALMWLRSGTPPPHPARQCNGPANEQRGGRVEDVAALLRCSQHAVRNAVTRDHEAMHNKLSKLASQALSSSAGSVPQPCMSVTASSASLLCHTPSLAP